jgi:predicted metal-dependent peptidase
MSTTTNTTALAPADIPERDNKLSQSLVYLVSPRGGNNYWARLINGCDKTFSGGAHEDVKTLGVAVAPNGRFVLIVNYPFFVGISERQQKLELVHEAGHIALRHHERMMRVMSQTVDPDVRMAVLAVWNIAVDLADNDQVVRNEAEFKDAEAAGELDTYLFPEKLGLPRGKTAEQYVGLVIQKLPKVHRIMMQLKSQQGGKGEKAPTQDGEGDGEGQQQDGGGGSGHGQKQMGSGRSKPSDDSDPSDAFITSGLEAAAKENPEIFKDLLDAHKSLTGDSHEKWNQTADKLTGDQLVSMANKMKKHSRQLAKSAHEQTVRSRGFIPSHIQSIIAPLLEPEQVPWNWFFRDSVAGAITSKIIPEMSSPNMGLLGESDWVEPWPGNMLDVEFNVYFLIDSSGSVSDTEFARAWNELAGLRKVTKNLHITVVHMDTTIGKVEDFDNANLPDPKQTGVVNRYKQGGTIYSPGFKLVGGVDTPEDWDNPSEKEAFEHKPADLVIVFTDGGVVIEGECFPAYRPSCGIIWLVAPNCRAVPGMDDSPPDRVINMFSINDYND